MSAKQFAELIGSPGAKSTLGKDIEQSLRDIQKEDLV
jgi:hypothetical protein